MSGPLLLLAAFACAVELFRRLRVVAAFSDLAAASLRVGRVARRRGRNELHRERAMQLVTIMLFIRSLRSGALLLLVVLPIAAAILIGPVIGVDVYGSLVDWQVRSILLVLMLFYAFVRFRIAHRS